MDQTLPPLHDTDPRVQLDVVGVLEGSDKASALMFCWDYLKHYELLFAPFRDQAINVIEVGVDGGLSMRIWKWYFSRANIIGIYVDPDCAKLAEDRVAIRIGAQTDGAFLQSVCTEAPPTIFIDDGSHFAEHIINTFEEVFPRLLGGGLYIIEDLAFHLGPSVNFKSRQKRNAVDYFLDLARSRMARQPVAGQEQVPARLHFLIDSITFIDSAIVIRRKHASRDVAAGVKAGQAYIKARKQKIANPQYLAAYILKHNGDLALAESICRQNIDIAARALTSSLLLSEILLRQGRAQEAVAMLHHTVSVFDIAGGRESVHQLVTLSRLQVEAGLEAAALQTAEKILLRAPRNKPALDLRRKISGG